jgi:transposase InsO family protein
LGLFSYYSRWIPAFSDKVKPLSSCKTFPLSQQAVDAFESLKKSVEKAVITAVDESIPFDVETDASDVALAATLNQNGRPAAFFSRTLQGSELKHAAVEKEAQAIIEAVRHWRHFLTGRHFTLKTDQKSVSYMFDVQHKGKIKNDKIMRWKLELACYSFDIVYRPGKSNVAPDTLSRATCATTSDSLYNLHESLCHPGVTRLYHFARSKNLPYSLEEIRRITRACKVCNECKPQFHRPEQVHLIKATKPFERLNVDFKGLLPTTDKNRYFLNVVDEFSRFPFVFPCPDMTTITVIKCLTTLFSLFGMPAYIHSDRGATFMSEELRTFLIGKGVATSRTTSYNPEGNGPVERYNGIIWKAIVTCLKSKNLPVKYWQDVLADALHSVRSLLCTATNETPHERFFGFSQRSTVGSSIPSWLLQPGPVLIKRQVRSSKQNPLVDEVELLQANPHYAHVRYPDGRETTVAIKHLAPRGQEMTCQPSKARNNNNNPSSNAEVTGSPANDTTDEPRDFGRSNGEQSISTQNEQSSSIEKPGSSHPVEEHNAEFSLRRLTD